MVRKKKTDNIENELYIIPSSSNEMRTFVSQFKIDMMEHVVSSIKFAVEQKLPLVEVFQFKDSPFVITIAEKEYISNLQNINKFYRDNQIFELCPKIEKLCEILKNKPDEKKQTDKGNKDSTGL